MTLEAAGVSEAEEDVYRYLVTVSHASAADVAERTGLGPAETEAVLDALTRKGMASHTDVLPRQFRATPPDVALMPSLKRHADALDLARVEPRALPEPHGACGSRRKD